MICASGDKDEAPTTSASGNHKVPDPSKSQTHRKLKVPDLFYLKRSGTLKNEFLKVPDHYYLLMLGNAWECHCTAAPDNC